MKGQIYISNISLSIDNFIPDSLIVIPLDNNTLSLTLTDFHATGQLQLQLNVGIIALNEDVVFSINDINSNAIIEFSYKDNYPIGDIDNFTIDTHWEMDIEFELLHDGFLSELNTIFIDSFAKVVERVFRLEIKAISDLIMMGNRCNSMSK